MINFLSSWTKNLSFALIIVSILEMLLPNNKTKKYIKMIMGLYILFSIISPFVENNDNVDLNNINLDLYKEVTQETYSSSEKVDQSSMDYRLNQIYKQELEKDITQKVNNLGYEIEDCKVIAKISNSDSGIEKISIRIKNKIDEEMDQDENNVEKKIVTEIQKIQKVEVKTSNTDSSEQENSNITKTDIKIISDFLAKEYGVSKECLKIS